MNRKLLFLLVLGLIAPSTAHSAQIYSLVDYPDLQNGYTVSGTITTAAGAPDDGLLAEEEILDWQWEVSNGMEMFVGQMHPIEPDSSSLTEVLGGIEIDSQGIYLPHVLGNTFKLEIGTNLNSRGANQWRLLWGNGTAFPLSQYVFNGVRGGDIGFQAWSSDLPATPNRWQIAARVPEPSGLALSFCVFVYATAMPR